MVVEMDRVVEAKAGSMLKFGDRIRGARAYISVAGGIDVPPVLGSRSTHVLTAMGGHQGRALRAGDTLELGKKGSGAIFARAPFENCTRPLFQGRLRVTTVDPELTDRLTSDRFRISPQSDRMGFRLEGGHGAATATGELISTAMPTGAIQVPPAGQPILLMNDHATTGGYRIASVVIAADIPLAGQLAPGDWVEFETCSVEDADEALRQREVLLGAS